MGNSVFAPSVAAVNSVLMLNPHPPLTVAEASHLAQVPHAVAKSALDTLAKRGLAQALFRNDQLTYEPNQHSPHYLTAYRAAIVDLPWIESLEKAGVSRAQVLAIFVHGSIARGSAGSKSDIDVLVISGVEPVRVIMAFQAIGEMTDRTIDPAVFKAEKISERIDAGDAAMAAILRDGIRVWGEFSNE